jgi:tetratricopeptide (TPR) repeat protein
MTLRAAEKPSPSDAETVGGWITKALEGVKDPKDPRGPVLFLAQANLLDQLGQFKEAGKIYEKIILRDPKNIIALNNLAILRALHENNPDEGRTLINRAIQNAGPMPELLDSRAVVLLQLEDFAQAAQDLEDVLAVAPTPGSAFRLAWVHHRANNPKGAKDALGRARDLGLKKTDLHPLEFQAYDEVTRALGKG